MSTADEAQKAFDLLASALRTGYPIRPRDILVGFPSARVAHLTREFAGRGLAKLGRWGTSDWLVPFNARMDLEEFNFVQSPKLMAALSFARENRIFTQKSLFQCLAGDMPVDGTARKLAARLWHLDLVEFRREAEGVKYFCVTPKGMRLSVEAEAYRMPAFRERSDSSDLSKFHTVLDLEPVRDP